MQNSHQPIKRFQQGSSLMEVMISLFVLAIGLMGVVALQTQAIKHNQNAYAATHAMYLANDIAERIRANPDGNYTLAANDVITPPATCTNCSADDLRKQDLAQWKSEIAKNLPDGSATITKAGKTHVVVVSFVDKKASMVTAQPVAQTFSLSVTTL
jgi:type IV pilus assembly protein PilV